MGYTDQEVVEGVKKNPKFLDALLKSMQERCETTLDKLLIADVETSREITEEQRSVVLRAFTNQQAADQSTSSPARRPRRPSAR